MGVFGGEEPAQLGETDDPTELIRGKASGVADKARVYRGIAEGIGDAAAGLSKLDDSAWTGEAADAYRRANEQETPRWKEAATAYSEAARALTDHGHVITSAQQGAARAIELWRQAEATTKQARAQHEQQQRSAPADAPPVPFDDPGKAGRAEAEAVLADARRSMKTSSATTADALRRARDRAPDPSMLERAWGLVQDQFSPMGEVAGSLAGGIGGALGEMGVGLITNLSRPVHLVTHPAETISAGANMAAGVVSMAAHPGQTLTGIVGTSAEWRNDPAAAFGKAWTNVGSMFTGVGTAGKVGATLGKVGRLTPDAPNPDAPKPPNTPNTPGSPKSTPQPQSPQTPQPPQPQPQQPPPSPPGGTPWNQPGGTPWNQPGGDGLGSSQYTPVQEPPAPQRGGSEDGFARPSGDASGGTDTRPEAAEAPPGPSQHRAPDRFGDMGGPDSWLDDGTGSGPDFDDWDDGGPLGDRGNGPASEPVTRESSEQVDGRPEHQSDEPRQEQRHEDPAPQRDHDETPGPASQTPEPESHGESRHDLSDEDRQTYRERIEMRTGDPFDESVARLRDEHPELAHLDDEEAMGLRRYIGEDANTLNRTLREGDAIDRDYLSPDANVLRSALDDMPRVDTAETPKAFRDMGVSDEQFAEVLERYRPGATVEEPAFTSASKDVPPEYFGASPDKPNHVRFIIEEPQHARDFEPTNPDEREMLWQDGNRFGVRDLEEVGDVLHIYMRDLGQGD
ncbi:WXG100 family type VII secretion target [Parasphingorhabdus pacifica]